MLGLVHSAAVVIEHDSAANAENGTDKEKNIKKMYFTLVIKTSINSTTYCTRYSR